MDKTSELPTSHYDLKLLKIQEKCLPILERLSRKFSEYKNLCTVLKDKRPPEEWLDRLEATCEKIQKKITPQFFENLVKADSKNDSKTSSNLEKGDSETLSTGNQTKSGTKTLKQTRWDVKPVYVSQVNEKYVTERFISKNDGRAVKNISASENRSIAKNGPLTIDFTSNKDKGEFSFSQEKSKSPLRKLREPDRVEEITASTAGKSPISRVRSNTQFASLEKVNMNPFHKKFTSDNMTLDSHVANLKYGTVFDLVKSKSCSSKTQYKNCFRRGSEGSFIRPTERNRPLSHSGGYESKICSPDNFYEKPPLSHDKPIVANLVSGISTHKKCDVKFVGVDKESKASVHSKLHDNTSKIKYGKSVNEIHGKMPFYKQNIARDTRYSYSEKSFVSHPSKDAIASLPLDGNFALSNSVPPALSVKNAQYCSVRFPKEACSFRCNCCEKTSHFSSMNNASHQPPTCVLPNSNYAFFPGKYFPNQQVILPSNTNLPSPFPTYAVPPLSATSLAVSIAPYSSKIGYSVPVFCSEESLSTKNIASTHLSWKPNSSYHQELICREINENSSRPTDPRTDNSKDRLNNSASSLSTDSSLTSSFKKSHFSGISEKIFSQSCTFLRPDNLYKDFKCHSDDFRNNSFESLKSFGLIKSVANVNTSRLENVPNKSTVIDSNSCLYQKEICKINPTKSIKYNESSHNAQSTCNTSKQEENQNNQVLSLQDNYISPVANLYNESNSTCKGYIDIINKQLENRKRKYDGLNTSDSKRKNVGKVKPMTKTCLTESEECFRTKLKQCPVESSLLKVTKNIKFNKVEKLHQSHSFGQWEKIKTPKEWIEKTCEANSCTSPQEKHCEPNTSCLTELKLPKNIQVAQLENSLAKEMFAKNNMKFSSEQKYKTHDSLTNQLHTSENKLIHNKLNLEEKDKLSCRSKYFNKSEQNKSERIAPNCYPFVDLKSLKDKEKLDHKKIPHEIPHSSKRVESNSKTNTKPVAFLIPSKIIQEFQKETSIDDIKTADKIKLRLKNDKKEFKTRIQPDDKCKSTDNKQTLEENSSLNKPVIIKSKGNKKINTHEKVNTSQDKGKSSCKHTSSKKQTIINNKSTPNQLFVQTENSVIQPKCNNHTLPTKNIKQQIKTVKKKSSSEGTKTKSKEECLEIKCSSRKRSIDQIKNCSVVLNREGILDIDDCTYINAPIENSALKGCTDNNHCSEKVNLGTKREIPWKDTGSKMQVKQSKTKSTENSTNCKREKITKKGKKGYGDMKNSKDDKVKDLLSRMKSLSKTEAIKVITEFASTFKEDKSQPTNHFSKDQRDHPKEEDKEPSVHQIKSKEKTKDDCPVFLTIENERIFNNIFVEKSGTAANISEIDVFSMMNSSLHSQLDESKTSKHFECKQNKTQTTSQETCVNIKNAKACMKNSHVSLTVSTAGNDTVPCDATSDDIVHKRSTEKRKSNKRKKLSELEKIQADLKSCHGLDDIMKCSTIRSCRLKNEPRSALKENTTDKQDKNTILTDSSEEAYFIEDEITIKMEPIPELTFDLIKQEPDYSE